MHIAPADLQSARSCLCMQELEERERISSEENDRLRELRDKEQADGDIVELRKKNDVSELA